MPRPPGLIVWLMFLAGCGATEPQVLVSIGVSPTPATVGSARVIVMLEDPQGSPVDGATVDVMAVPPGGEPQHMRGEPSGRGAYVVENLQPGVSGEWMLEVRVTLPDGRTTEARMPMRVVSSRMDPR